MEIFYTRFDSPVGNMWIGSACDGVVWLELPGGTPERFFRSLQRTFPQGRLIESHDANAQAIAEILEYLQGQRRTFSVHLDPHGTEFQRTTWKEIANIPYGETRSYGDIARAIGRPKALRAVGAASGANPLPLFIPCHRVVGSNGALTGYGGGIELKRKLLEMEQRWGTLPV